MTTELKILHKSLDQTLDTGLRQTREYMDRCGASEGHLVVFDRDAGNPWDDKIFHREEESGGVPIQVWGM